MEEPLASLLGVQSPLLERLDPVREALDEVAIGRVRPAQPLEGCLQVLAGSFIGIPVHLSIFITVTHTLSAPGGTLHAVP